MGWTITGGRPDPVGRGEIVSPPCVAAGRVAAAPAVLVTVTVGVRYRYRPLFVNVTVGDGPASSSAGPCWTSTHTTAPDAAAANDNPTAALCRHNQPAMNATGNSSPQRLCARSLAVSLGGSIRLTL
ncbi:MAG: hypothetical protein ACRDP6_47235 [Actinoallomurus sp.]